LTNVAQKFQEANKMTEQAQKELDEIQNLHNQAIEAQTEESSSASMLQNPDARVQERVGQLSAELKDMSISLQQFRGEKNAKKTKDMKAHLTEVQNNLSRLQEDLNNLKDSNLFKEDATSSVQEDSSQL